MIGEWSSTEVDGANVQDGALLQGEQGARGTHPSDHLDPGRCLDARAVLRVVEVEKQDWARVGP